MSSIDDMKNKLHLDNLEKQKREELFNKFVEKGGKVVQDKKNVKPVNIDKSRQLAIKKQLDKDSQNKNRGNEDKSNSQPSLKPPVKKNTGGKIDSAKKNSGRL